MIKQYISITKPGIIRANLITAAAAFLFASAGNVSWVILLFLLFGTSLVIGSAAIANNIIDVDIDIKMNRTKNRSIATGNIATKNAALMSLLMVIVGLVVLFVVINPLTAIIGLLAHLSYVFVYGYYKRRSVHGTLIGSIPGAAAPLAGYTAALDKLDLVALVLFLNLVFWQMPHFYSIALFRLNDYKKAKIPVLPLVKGLKTTKIYILAYIGLFVFGSILIFALQEAHWGYISAMIIVNFYWAKLAIDGFKDNNSEKWSKKMFGASLLVLLIYSIALALFGLLA